MEVNRIKGLYPYRPLGSTGKKGPAEFLPTAERGSAAEGDVVSISHEAAFRVKLEGYTKQLSAASKTYEAGQQMRVQALKEKYQGDSCPVSGYDVARALMNTVLGE